MSHFHLCCCFVLLPLFTLLSSATVFKNKNYANFHQKLATFYVDHSELLQKTLDHFVPDLLAIKKSEHLHHCYNRSIISSKTDLASGKKIVEKVDIFSDRLETIAKSFFAHNIHYFDKQEQSGQKHLLKRRLDVLLENLVKLAGYVKQCVKNRENGENGEKVENEPTTVVGLTSMIFYSEEEFRTSILNHHLAETLSTHTNQSIDSSPSSNETENTSSDDDDEYENEYELNRRRTKSAACHPTLLPNESIPISWSWKEQQNNSILSPVYDQGRCSSCYVFATTEALEAQYRLHHQDSTSASSKYFRLSVQATLNCVEHGCQGGTLEKPLAYFKRWGLPLMSAAPYQGRVAPGGGSCKKYRKIEVKPKITCFDTCDKRVETMQLMVWKRGPVAVSFNAQTEGENGKNMCDKFRFFRGSLWEEDCSDGPPNHALLLVGWTAKREWILKNSWGENWGEEGYFKLPMYNRTRCGITRMMGLSLLGGKPFK